MNKLVIFVSDSYSVVLSCKLIIIISTTILLLLSKYLSVQNQQIETLEKGVKYFQR